MVKILSYSELTERQRAIAPALDWEEQDPPSFAERMMGARVDGHPFQSYDSLLVVDRGVPLARVDSVRVAFRTVKGSQQVCGVADVVTRHDAVRRGFARTLLRETHRRARDEGVRWSVLWTRRSWGAHRAYEELGYRDLYSPSIACRKIPPETVKRGLPSEYHVRRARTKDAGVLDEIFSRATRDRIGFVPRSERTFEVRFRTGWREPKEFLMLFCRRKPVGYAWAFRDRFDVQCRELLVTRPSHAHPMLQYIESMGRGRWVAFKNTSFIRDHAAELRKAGYFVLEGTHGVMMACPLTRAAASEWAEMRRTVADGRFSLHNGDMF